jgi:hypothetical protein
MPSRSRAPRSPSSRRAHSLPSPDPDVVYVAALVDPYGPTTDRGVCTAADGRDAWRRDERIGAADLMMAPGNPEVLYASLWEVFRTPHSLPSGGPLQAVK